MKIMTNVDGKFGDEIQKDQIVTLDIEINGVTKPVDFKVFAKDETSVRLWSTECMAYCQSLKSAGNKAWPCTLHIWVMTVAGRAQDAQYPARKSMPTWSLSTTTTRLNRQYGIRGWYTEQVKPNLSQHGGARWSL